MLCIEKVDKQLEDTMVVKVGKDVSPPWLVELLKKKQPANFPYHYASTHARLRFSDIVVPDAQVKNPPQFKPLTSKPIYVLNIPVYIPDSMPLIDSAKRIQNLIKMIEKQAFYEPNANVKDKAQVEKRIFVVLGLNRPFSMDSEKNKEFESWVKKFPKIKGIEVLVQGRFWHPKIQIPNRGKAPIALAKEVELEEKALSAFRLLKSKSTGIAAKVQAYVKDEKFVKTVKKVKKKTDKSRLASQIPFQQLRQWLVKTTLSQEWLQKLLKKEKPPQIYLHSLDGDTLSLNDENSASGLFLVYDKLVAQSKTPPMLMSTGYFVSKKIDDVTRLANEIDMKMRQRLNKKKPGSVYLVDPNLGVSLTAFRKNLEVISWEAETGNDAEARALFRNLSSRLVAERVHFVAVRALITTPPDRLLATIAKHFKKGIKCKDLTSEIFKSIRGVSQTHLMPKIWAANMYVSLQAFDSIKGVTGKAAISRLNKPLMDIFNLFDVPKFIEEHSFEVLAKLYKAYVDILLAAAKEKVVKEKDYKVPKEPIIPQLSAKIKILMDCLEKLKEFLPRDASRYNIVLAAASGGLAVYDVLKNRVTDFPSEKEEAAAAK